MTGFRPFALLAVLAVILAGFARAEEPARIDGHSVVRVTLTTEDDLRTMLEISDDP